MTLTETLKQFVTFISLFIGTGFIAGSLVHFGEGITVWDSSVLILGIILFVGASFVNEYGKHHKRSTPYTFALFIVQSLLLAIGIGMASGGTQHFIDTPAYSSLLIPLGLSLGVLAYFWREEIQMPIHKWVSTLVVIGASATLLFYGLISINNLIPDSLRVGHGSHGAHESNTQQAEIEGSHIIEPHFNEDHEEDGHGH